MAADALAPYITRTSEAMLLSMHDQWVHVFYEERFQTPAPSNFWEMIENANIFYVSENIFSMQELIESSKYELYVVPAMILYFCALLMLNYVQIKPIYSWIICDVSS